MFLVKQTGLLFFVILLLLATGCSSKDIEEAMRDVHSTDLSIENLDGMKVGASFTESFFSQQGSFEPHPDNQDYSAQRNFDQYWNDRLILGVDRDTQEILQIHLLENNLTTESAKGIRIGMPLDQVISVYGEDYFTYNDEEQTIYLIGYVDHLHNSVILFTHFDEKVTNINLRYAFDRLKWK